MTTIVAVRSDADRVLAVHRARELARALAWDDRDRGAFETIVLELSQNLIDHGGGGEIHLRRCDERGLEVVAIDRGRGIARLGDALRGGVSPRAGLGEGLAAVRRLGHELRVTTHPSRGTVVLARRWARAR
ncbi:ATP-binding protein [Sandaracinus amylolyticus]|uniref:Anti-sigma B factor RsbT n=1 Tax=Sandaracinus amylolyticus TaxID=927083 RepID=A0A0F6YN22_9BACT|nr:ATP-binding protein [Sandaracinus amylolyticus]AKF09910.1 Anti-sigma B factor RsbT [Sandaracinus amylolyticus]